MYGRYSGDGKGCLEGITNHGERLAASGVRELSAAKAEIMKISQETTVKYALRPRDSYQQKIVVSFKRFGEVPEKFKVFVPFGEKLLKIEAEAQLWKRKGTCQTQ